MKTASILISLATIGSAAAANQQTATKLDNDGSDSISAGGIRASKLVTTRTTNKLASSTVGGSSSTINTAAKKQQINNDKLNLLKHQNIPTLSYEASKRNEVTRRHEIGEELRKKVYELKKMEKQGAEGGQEKIQKKTARRKLDTGSKSTTKKKTQAANNNMKRRNLVETKKRTPSSTTPTATDNTEEKGKILKEEEEERILKKTKSDKGGGGDWNGGNDWSDKGWNGSSNSHDNWGKPSGGWNDDDDDDWFNKGWSKPSGGWGSDSHDSSWGNDWGSGKANKGSGDWGWGGSGKSGKSGGGSSWGNDWGSGKSGKSGGSGWGSGKAGKGSWGGDNWGSGKAGKGWGSGGGGGWNSHHWNGGGWCGDQAYVTVTNLSFKQSFSEIFAMTGLWKVTDDKPIYVFGDHANEGLRELSTNADAGEMEDRYKDKWGVEQVKTFKDFDFGSIDNRFLNGGASATFKVRTSGFGEYLSIAVGLPFTNDGAVVLQGVPIYDGAEYYIPAIDAGVEGNIQTCWSVEAKADEFPPQSQCYDENNADDNINHFGGEGYVSMHRGIQDLDNGNELADLLEFVECDDIDLDSNYPFVEYFSRVGFNHPVLFCKDYYFGMVDFRDCDIFDDGEFLDNIDDLPEALQDSILIELARISDGNFDEFCDLISDANKQLEDGFKVLEPWFFDWRNEIMKVDVKCWLDDGWEDDGWDNDGWEKDDDGWGGSHWASSSSSSSSRSYDLDNIDWSLDDNRKKNGKN